jgi:hypothetical protein
MNIQRRSVIGMAGMAAGATVLDAATLSARQTGASARDSETPFQLIEHVIVKHGGDCCGCAVSKEVGEIICNECGQTLDVLVSEVAFLRMAEALIRAHHALTATSGLMAHDGKPEHTFSLDHARELRFIEDSMQLADIDFQALKLLDPWGE